MNAIQKKKRANNIINRNVHFFDVLNAQCVSKDGLVPNPQKYFLLPRNIASRKRERILT